MSIRELLAIALLLPLGTVAMADPIHAGANGEYWHHESGWVFPKRCGGFERIGAAQDVAGTRDAVSFYEREWNGLRVIASVHVLARDSAAADLAPADSADPQATYVLSSGEWRVRIQLTLPGAASEVARELDGFVQAQRWETLGTLH